MTQIFGYYHKTTQRCDYCHIPRDRVYVVRDGPTTGTFCSALHYNMACEAMKEKKAPEHEQINTKK